MPCTTLGRYDYKHANVFESMKNINININNTSISEVFVSTDLVESLEQANVQTLRTRSIHASTHFMRVFFNFGNTNEFNLRVHCNKITSHYQRVQFRI